MTPDVPPSTSASQLVTYAMCPRKYGFTYVYGAEPEFRSIALILGSAVHSAIGWWHMERLSGRTPVMEAAEGILSADLLAGTAGTNVRWKNATPESLDEDARRYLRVYLKEHGDLPVQTVEEAFRVELVDPDSGEVCGRPLKGFFDLTLVNHRVIEIKTSSRGWNENDLLRHLQVGAYAFAWNTLHGGPSRLDIHVIVKLKREPRVETYSIERGEPATRWWLTAAKHIEAAIAAGHFPPSPSALCQECEYASACARWTEDARVRTETPSLPIVRDEHLLAMSL